MAWRARQLDSDSKSGDLSGPSRISLRASPLPVKHPARRILGPVGTAGARVENDKEIFRSVSKEKES